MARKFICMPDYPVVETKQGKLRGFVLDDIFSFRGVQYAKAARFHIGACADDAVADALLDIAKAAETGSMPAFMLSQNATRHQG